MTGQITGNNTNCTATMEIIGLIPKTKKIRIALIAGLAALAAALAFTAALRFAADTPEETARHAPPSSEQTAEPPSQTAPNGVSEEAVEDARKPTPATAQEDRDPDLQRWTRLMRTQLELRGIQGDELEQRLEQRRGELAGMDSSKREEHVVNSGFQTVKWNPEYSDQKNRIRQKLFELTGSTRPPDEAPPEIIEMLVEGKDDLTAAINLFTGWSRTGWRPEFKYANIYVDRALAKDPTSRDALVLKADLAHYTRMSRNSERVYSRDAALRLFELYPDDQDALLSASNALYYDYPEDAITLLESMMPKGEPHWARRSLGVAYERLDMMDMANRHYILIPWGHHTGPYYKTPGSPRHPSIWEERAAAAAESAQQAAPPDESPAPGMESPPVPRDIGPPHDQPDAPEPDAPRPEGAPPLPPGEEIDMATAYADFAKAYQSMFEMEYGLSDATPEGYMNALLEMARAFARAGDAQHAQDAYNAVRKRHSREEVEQVFRKLDERERLKRQPSEDGEEDDDE